MARKSNAPAKKRKSIADWPFFRLVLTLLSTVLAVTVLTFSALIIVDVMNATYERAPIYLMFIFLALGLMAIVKFLKDRTKVNFIAAMVIIAFNVALGIISLFAKDNPFLFALTAGLYCISIIIGRIFNIIRDHSLRNIILNVLVIALAVAIAIGLLTSPTNTTEDLNSLIILECVFIAVVSFIEAMSIALAQLKVKVLFRIVVSTFSLEVLFGLLIMIATFSFVFVATEDTITNYGEALWYCFAVVTTIGFGDFAATSLIGRILTVFLGIYGLIVVAVITSIIVNFYNETAGKKDSKELKEISDDEDNK